MENLIQPVILCGGSGSRLWPLSRTNFPKPFITFAGGQTLFQQAFSRVSAPGFAPPLVVCAESQRFLVLEQKPGRAAAIILEPTPRNTAPACLLAAHWAVANGRPDGILAFVSADHAIPQVESFRKVLQAGAELAAQGHIVLFGIKPTTPHTGYGYIHARPVSGTQHEVLSFVEKPDATKAAAMLAEGGYFWNSGIFMARADVLLAELTQHRPEMAGATTAAMEGAASEMFAQTTLIRPAAAFAACQAEAIDTALHENTAKAVMLPYTGRWNDVGNWDAVMSELTLDASGNTTEGRVVTKNVSGSLIKSLVPGKPVAVIGLTDVVVVDMPDALLVTTRAEAAKVKNVVEELNGAPDITDHRRVLRPWGWYETLEHGPGFLVKRIQVNPGAKLSLQYHHHRAEHWVCVRGIGTVTRGEETLTLQPDESTYLPQGMTHRLANNTADSLEIIEVQTGAILKEDDIVRVEDAYGRS
jgi:mannose-1-phosphate guanylyltransferase/mannose-6-phosphate isomerase